MKSMNPYITDNTASAIPLAKIPEAAYADFYDDLSDRLSDPRYHVAHYFALPAATGCASSASCSTTRNTAYWSPRTPWSIMTRRPYPR